MFRRLIFLLAVATVLTGCVTPTTDEPTRPGAPTAREMADVNGIRFRQLDAVNALRAERGMPALAYSNALNSAALTHARDMALQQRAWHFGTDRSNPQSRAVRAGYGGLVIGENIAEAFESDIVTLQNWLDERSAAAVILEPRARDFGFAWFREASGKIWWVQLLGEPRAPTPQLLSLAQ